MSKIRLSENVKSVLIVAASAAAFVGAVRGISFIRKKLAGRRVSKAEKADAANDYAENEPVNMYSGKPLFEEDQHLKADDRVEVAGSCN